MKCDTIEAREGIAGRDYCKSRACYSVIRPGIAGGSSASIRTCQDHLPQAVDHILAPGASGQGVLVHRIFYPSRRPA